MNDAASNHDRSEAIAVRICDAVIQIQTVHPDWIRTKFRHHSLADNRSKLIQKILTPLHNPTTPEKVIEQVTHLLMQLLEPIVSETNFYEQIQHLITAEISTAIIPFRQPLMLPSESAACYLQHSHQQPKRSTQALSILLLDAENIDLSQSAEAWLESLCQYPLSLKFAFGNWKTLGKRDAVLHQRGYQLLHVPQGKNHADDKMTMIGSSILVHLPTIKAAIVCSNDNGLENLRHTLRFQGLDVNLVQRHQQTLKFINCKTKQSSTFKLSAVVKMPSIEQGIQYFQTYVEDSEFNKVALSDLSLAFSKALGFSIRSFVRHHHLAKTPKAFFEKSEQFIVSLDLTNSQFYIQNYVQNDSLLTGNLDAINQSRKEFTALALRRVCVGIFKHLVQQQGSHEVSVAMLASTFRQQHGKPIKTVLKHLGLGQSVPKFLQTCEGIKLQKQKAGWMITLSK